MRLAIPVLGALAMAASGWGQVPKSKSGCDHPPEGPLTLFKIVHMLLSEPNGHTCLKEFAGKVALSADIVKTPLLIQLLRDSDAPAELLDSIPDPPPPPKPPMVGVLTITCAPDCDQIIVNDHLIGRTTSGRREVSGLSPGSTQVRASARGYEAAENSVVLRDGEVASVSFTLQPDATHKRENGRDQMLAVAKHFGGLSGLFEMSDVEVAGKLIVYDSEGKTQEWNVAFSQSWDRFGLEFFKDKELKAKNNCVLQLGGGGAQPAACIGRLKTISEKDKALLIRASELMRTHQLQAILAIALSQDVVPATTGSGSTALVFGDGEKFEMQLNENGLPAVVIRRPKEGDAVRIEYLDYQIDQNRQYPHRLKISNESGDKPIVDLVVESVRPPTSTETKKGR